MENEHDTNAESESTPVVLVHGAFVDASGWEDVYHALRKAGFPVSVVQHATATLADDVVTTRRVLDAQTGYLAVDKLKFHASFAADLSADKAAFMADSRGERDATPWRAGRPALSSCVALVTAALLFSPRGCR
jgi:hypothetical protein